MFIYGHENREKSVTKEIKSNIEECENALNALKYSR
jgi:hypothetical protein